jgi:hypothetical protein
LKKQPSILVTALIAVAIVILVGILAVVFTSLLDYPKWSTALGTILVLFAFFEVIGRLAPESRTPPSIQFLRLSNRDKVIYVIAFIGLFLFVVFIK